MPDLSTTGDRTIDTPPGTRRGLPAYCGCCGCLTRYCNCSCCCQRSASSGPRGNSYANGASVANGPLAWTWPGGMQAPRPESFWDWA